MNNINRLEVTSSLGDSNSLVFVDTGIDSYQSLVSHIDSSDIVLLDSNRDGIEQISETLSSYRQLDAIHIISHGDNGSLQLGDSTFGTHNLDIYQDHLSQWSESLSTDADLLFYGCNLANDLVGQEFLNNLSNATGADIAASTNLTGDSSLGGDWILEATVGSIETTSLTFNNFEAVLATYNGNEYRLTSGNLSWAEAQAEAEALGGNLVTINDAAEQRWLEDTFGGVRLWIGLNDRSQEGDFEWNSEEALTYTNWANGTPDNFGRGEDVVLLLPSGRWNDVGGNADFQGIIEIGNNNPVEPEIFNYNGNEYRLTSGNLSWAEAQAEAEALGGNLVTINDAAEQRWLEDTFGGVRLWIGLNDRSQEGDFEWNSEEALTYTNWANGTPDNFGRGEDVVLLLPSGRWNDVGGNADFQGIIEIGNNNPQPDEPGVIGLETNLYQVDETEGTVEVTILRTQGSDGVVTVDFQTVDAAATSGSDYTAVNGTATFADGETSKTISVPITDDAEVEGIEDFSFTIDNVTGGATLLAPRTARVEINSEDQVSGASNYNGNQYILTSGIVTWQEAQAEAEALGGNLVSINDAAEEAWLRNNFGIDEGFWIGLNDIENEGDFQWVSGQPVTYTNWAPGEPNNFNGVQDFGWMNFLGDKWDDNSPDAVLRGIIEIGGANPSDNNGGGGNNSSLNSETIVSGLTQPTAVEWSPDGEILFIAEKGGVIKTLENGQLSSTPFIDISDQVNGTRDRGLLDIAVHPDFFNGSPYVYALYTYDPPEVFANSGLAGEDGNGNRAARLTRITADALTGYTTAVPGSEVVILGKNSTWENFNAFTNSTNDFDEPPAGILSDGSNLQDFLAADSESHTIGSVEFGTDGALYVSNGDGTSFNRVDPRTVRVQDVDNLSGKILRIDPITGRGLTDNPFYDGNPDSNRSKVYQLGLRNPFRITVDPRNGDLYVGDVGWTQWEEINSAEAGANFGWPYYEGGSEINLQTGGYRDLAEAQAFYNSGVNATPAILGLGHGTSGVNGIGINAIVLGDIYTGDAFPEEYQGDLFFNDLGRGIVYNVSFDDQGNVSSFDTFTTGANVVVQILEAPDGSLYYVDLDDGLIGRWFFS